MNFKHATLALRTKRVTDVNLASLYRNASSLTRPALAACCGAAQFSPKSGLGRALVKAVQQDGKLSAAGYAYGADPFASP